MRFYVSELRGFHIHPAGSLRRGGYDKPPLLCTVHDRIYCHREIASFDTHEARGGDGYQLPRPQAEALIRERARALADRLNAKHACWRQG